MGLVYTTKRHLRYMGVSEMGDPPNSCNFCREHHQIRQWVK